MNKKQQQQKSIFSKSMRKCHIIDKCRVDSENKHTKVIMTICHLLFVKKTSLMHDR
jgi:hypothetical protein